MSCESRTPWESNRTPGDAELVEGDGWVNWSGLATLLSSLGPDLWPPLRRLLGEIDARRGGRRPSLRRSPNPLPPRQQPAGHRA
jgi:hypothetical protein